MWKENYLDQRVTNAQGAQTAVTKAEEETRAREEECRDEVEVLSEQRHRHLFWHISRARFPDGFPNFPNTSSSACN